MSRYLLLFFPLLLFSCSSGDDAVVESGTTGFRGSGSEPFWLLDLDFETGMARLVVKGEDPSDRTFPIPPPSRGYAGDSVIYEVPIDRQIVRIGITQVDCRGGAGDRALPYTARVVLADYRTREVESDMSGCGQYNGRGELSRRWRLVELDGDAVSATRAEERLPTIQLNLVENTLNGDGGCNYFTGEFRIDGDSLHIGTIPSTKMACPRIGRESAFIGALRQKGHRIAFDDGRLVLRRDGGVLVFERE